MKLIAGLLALGCMPLASAFTCIDDFTSGDYEFQTKTAGIETIGLQAGTMAGGHRLVSSYVSANPTTRSLYYINVGGGLATVESGTRLENLTIFAYGYKPTDQTFATEDLNLDLSKESAFKLDFLSNESDIKVEIKVRSSEQNGGAWIAKTFDIAGGRTDTVFSELFAFGNFSGFDFSNVDQLYFGFTNKPSGDYALSGQYAVPEPATMAGLLVGGAALLMRRKRK